MDSPHVSGNTAVLAGLASHFSNVEVGKLIPRKQVGQLWPTTGSIDTPVATKANADGTVSDVTIGPGAIGLEAVVGANPDARTLTLHDAEYDYAETR